MKGLLRVRVSATTLLASALLAAPFARCGPPTLLAPNQLPFQGVTAAGDAAAPRLTPDGRFVLFLSRAPNVTTNPPTGALNVYRRDRTLGLTDLVSVGTDGTAADGNCGAVAVSTNGQIAVFQSTARNLSPGCTNGWPQIFVRDLNNGRTTCLSTNRLGAAGSGPSGNPNLTPDGRWVVFESAASDLLDGDLNGAYDVFAHNLETGETVLVSADLSGSAAGNAASLDPFVSADGRYVAFQSAASNLVTNDANTTLDVFVRDRITGTTALASALPNGMAAGSTTRCDGLSADGRFVLFTSTANGLVSGDVDRQTDIFLRDLVTRSNRMVTASAEFYLPHLMGLPSMCADASIVAFQREGSIPTPDSTFPQSDVYVWRRETGLTTLISTAFGTENPATGCSFNPCVTDDGQFVIFQSTATNLVAEATSGRPQIYRHELGTGLNTLVSANPDGTGQNLDCSEPTTSDGQRIAFASIDPALAANDLNRASDVFVRDLNTPGCEVISVASPSIASSTPVGGCAIGPQALSSDGRYLTFTSGADHLVPADTNGYSDVFRRDLVTGDTLLVSVAPNGVSGDAPSHHGVMSRDGRFVAFSSSATNLTTSVTNRTAQIYLRDLDAGQLWLVSAGTNRNGSQLPAHNPVVSPNGRFVTFESRSSGLVPGDANGQQDVFLFDRISGSNSVVSVATNGIPAGGNSRSALFTPDGSTVVFISQATTLVTNRASGPHVYARDLATGVTRRLSPGTTWDAPDGLHPTMLSADSRFLAFVANAKPVRCDLQTGAILSAPVAGDRPAISADGRFLAFERTDAALLKSVWLWDAHQGAVLPVSLSTADATAANRRSHSPVVLGNGRFIVFSSAADNLGDDDENQLGDVFLRDLFRAETTLLSATAAGRAGSSLSGGVVPGPDDSSVLFASFSTDLATNDLNHARDVFLVRFDRPDTDTDGLDDDWELAYFPDLGRDGTGDADGDGMSDLAEFKAGTNPGADGSILRAWTSYSVLENRTTVFWQASPGRTYQVQYRESVDAPGWAALPTPVTATANTGSLPDADSGTHPSRFYRVVLVAP